MIGRTFGDYRILEKRGEGGMGMFYRAVDLRLDRIVGLKTLRAELLDDPGVLERLQSEAKSLARLDHPNIARLLHYLVSEGQHFIVMEYVDGPDLAAKVRQEGLLPLPALITIVHQICAAIGYAHSKSVIHRDIKPSNVLLAGDGTVKVTDFGIAKILGVSARTRTGMATGSLPYMAPEQIRGSGVDPRTDIYQLGVALFELTTGRRPFVAESEYEMMTMHLEAEPPKPSSVNPHLSPTVDQVIAKALAKAPGDRYPSAAELDAALQKALVPGSEVVTTFKSVTPEARRSPLPKKTRRLAYLAAISALAALALILWATRGGRGPVPPPGMALVRIVADLPPEVDHRIVKAVAYRLRAHSGEETNASTLWPAGTRFDQTVAARSGDSIRFTLLLQDTSGNIIAKGLATRDIPPLGPTTVNVPLVPASPSGALRTTIAAKWPSGVMAVQPRRVFVSIVYPDWGMVPLVPRRLTDDPLIAEVALAPADSLLVRVEVDDLEGRNLKGQRWVRAPSPGEVKVDVAIEQSAGPPFAALPRAGETAPARRSETTAVAPGSEEAQDRLVAQTQTPNLTIDVQPFTARDLVDQLWIDGRKVSGRLPLKTRVAPGVRFIRWQIGRDRFTDTVTVDATGSAECALFAETGEGRLNVAASFADGGYGEIWLDGVDMGQGTPAELRGIPTGPHEVTVRREGYRMRSQPPIARVRTNDRARVEVEMIPEK